MFPRIFWQICSHMVYMEAGFSLKRCFTLTKPSIVCLKSFRLSFNETTADLLIHIENSQWPLLAPLIGGLLWFWKYILIGINCMGGIIFFVLKIGVKCCYEQTLLMLQNLPILSQPTYSKYCSTWMNQQTSSVYLLSTRHCNSVMLFLYS